ncbi:Transglutaminase-like enzyme [Christiangramia flava JLT2011]|uniref:Uncharacterized protein n=2 Tax=Christiangramia TaxID=292691 RepID=A0A1L7I6L6_9FLAO|nr:hypothetical protein GRFL_2099 [Christiangramia flava JLT2011]OSS39032.1 Transglutaminase-like enzyme [Christiangramia flava JLT2011]
MTSKKLMQVLITCLLSGFVFSQSSKISITELPDWIQPVQFENADEALEKKAGSFLYLLVDNQDHIPQQKSFRHRAYQIFSSQGIQDAGDITIDFDPEYQDIEFHSLKIIRDGKTINKLYLKDIQTVQRESNMERHIFDGSLTAIVNISDVRVNDIIEYSYTLHGYNPVHKGKYQNTYYLDFSVPLGRLHTEILTDRPIHYKVFNSELEPKISNRNGLKSYAFDILQPKTVDYEDNVPSWYDANSYVQFSEYTSWKQVVGNYEPYFRVDHATRKFLQQQLANDFFEPNEDSLTQILRFVQDDIRYLGFEGGLNSHKPSDPKEVFERRFGDCKDKSLLLAELLKTQGIQAFPVLLNSVGGQEITEMLPSAKLFDHCIVQVQTDEGVRYIDPTINNQGGYLYSTYSPDYKFGLVLSNSSSEIVKFPSNESKPVEIFETIHVEDIGGDATMNVSTTYYGSNADARRSEFSDSSLESIQENYLDYYRLMYPSIEADEEIIFDDFRGENKIIVTESYKIPGFWSPSPENDQIIQADFYPLSLDSYVFPSENTNRKMPFYLNDELNINHNIAVILPESWNIEEDEVNISNKNFQYNYEVSGSGKRIDISHSYKNLSAFVAPEDYSAYVSDIQEIQKNLTYSITYNKGLGDSIATAGISWPSVMIIAIALFAFSFLCYKVYYRYDPRPELDPRVFHRPIGGWLVLIAIGLCVAPVVMLVQLFQTPEYLGPATWELWRTGNPGMTLFILFEMIYNCGILVFGIFAAIVFFKKRTIAPKVMIVYLAASFVFLLADTVIALSLMPDYFTPQEESEFYGETLKAFFRAGIWIPYFLVSKRVKETFTVTLKDEPEPLEPAEEEVLIPLE